MPFECKELELPGVKLVTHKIFGDKRGFFTETYKHSDFVKFGIAEHFVQDNSSFSQHGIIRGLHYQKNPAAQSKLVRCVKGKIFDVAVDLRKGSPHYGKWVGKVLDAASGDMLYIPEGFAHGFSVLSETADVMYKVNREYSPENDRGIRWNDPDIGVDWQVDNPALSPKDAVLPLLKDCDCNFVY